jgi:aspartate 1-decarboxylase
MRRWMMKSKVHRATVTGSHINYMGSITLDPRLMEAVDLLPYELVHVLNLDNGARVETYVIVGRRGSGQVQLNGAAARFFTKGDRVIVIAYADVDENELGNLKPRMAFVNAKNRITEVRVGRIFPKTKTRRGKHA